MKLSYLSRGTTIVSIPFNEGLAIVSDTQATDTNTFEVYSVSSKTTMPLGYTIQGVQFFISGAGASIGTEYIMMPFLQFLQKKTREFCIDLNHLSITQFVDYYNNIGSLYVSTKAASIEGSLYQSCVFLITVKTKKFLGCFKSSMPGALCLNRMTPNKDDYSLLCGVGSGCRYVLGALLLQDKVKPLMTWTQNQLMTWIQKFFEQCIMLDKASGVQSGLNVRVVYRDSRSSTYKSIFKV